MALGTNTRNILVNINSNAVAFATQMGIAGNAVAGLQGNIKSLGKTMTTKLTLPLVALGGVLIKTASDVEQMSSKFSIVFGDLSEEVTGWSEEVADVMSRSKYDIQEYAVSFQDLLKPMGFMADEAKELSKDLTTLGIDVASLNHKSDVDVMRDFQGALTGSSETVKKYGIIINDATIKQEAERMGIKRSVRELTELEKVRIKYNILVNSTTDAHGNAELTAHELANEFKNLQGSLKELSKELGEELMPMATDVVVKLTELADKVAGMDSDSQKRILAIGAIVASAGPLLLILSALISSTTVVLSTAKKIPLVLGKVKTAIMGVTASTAGLVIGLAGIVGGMAVLIKFFKDYGDEIERVNTGTQRMKDIYADGIIDSKEFDEGRESMKKITQELDDIKNKGLEVQRVLEGTELKFIIKPTVDYKGTAYEALKIQHEINSKGGLVDEIQLNFGDIETFLKANNDFLNIQQQRAIVTKDVKNAVDSLTNAESRNKDTLSRLVKSYDITIESMVDEKERVNDLVKTYNDMSVETNLNIEDKKALKAIEDELSNTIGVSSTIIDKQTNSLKLNMNAINNYNDTVSGSISSMTDTTTKGLLDYKKELDSQYEQAEYKRAIARTEYMMADDDFSKKEYQKKIDALETHLLDIEDLRQQADDKLIEKARENTDLLIKNAKDRASEEIQAEEELQQKLEELRASKVNKEISLNQYKYDVQEKTLEEYSAKLKWILKNNSRYYEENLNEELNIRRQIYQSEQQLEESRIQDKINLLNKANDDVIDGINKEKQALKEKYDLDIGFINDKKNAEIQAFEEVERKLSDSRDSGRIEEINQLLEVYKQSTSASGQAEYKKLIQEREDLQLDLQKSYLDKQSEVYDEINDIRKSQYEDDLAEIDNKETLIENNYKELINNINNITDELSSEAILKIDNFKIELNKGIADIFNIDNIPKFTGNIQALSIDTNLSTPEAVKTGQIYNVKNDITLNNSFNISSEMDIEETGEKLTKIIIEGTRG